jgi:hypothetical protein
MALCSAAWGAEPALVADAHVNSAQPTVNSGAISNLNVGGGYTSLLQFDLSLLPTGTTASQVSRVVLRLYCNRVTTPGLVSLAPVNAAWGEYSVTYATEPAIGSATSVFTVSQAGAYVAVDVTTLVQGWISNPTTNNGLALSAGTANVQFDSKENDLTAHAATLDVELVDAGPTGATGATGLQGPAGATGATGATGAMGPQGLQGSAGLQGAQGIAGPAGAQGLPGATGSAGPAGAIGAIGATGAQGPTGLTGATGLQGPTGVSGAQGSVGSTGATGAAGAVGMTFKGAWGNGTGYAANDSVTYGGSTYIALSGNTSQRPDNYPVAWSLLAAQGATGAAGSSGATGASGAQGPQGVSGSVGPQGEKGDQGAQGIAGPAGAQGLTGATGATGASGPMGPQGPAGPVGLSFQGNYSSTTNYALADGVHYNGEDYVSLAASNYGNTPDQSPTWWALFAQDGAIGATGPTGATGATGSTGPAGSPGATGQVGATGPIGPPGMTYKGAWVTGTGYAASDSVSYGGSTYIALSGNTSQRPDNYPAVWSLLAAQGATGATGAAGAAGSDGAVGAAGPAGSPGATGPQGPPVSFKNAWLIGTAYALGDAVSYGGSSYIALVANVGREPDVSPVYWGLLAAAGATGAAGPTGATGLQGPTGVTGAAGATGVQGPIGPTGATGATGLQGSAGANGVQGPVGPTGATGATGTPGTDGAPGATGAAGAVGMTFKGAWVTGTGYAENDSVTYNGSTYIATGNNNSAQPDLNPASWFMLAQAGSTGPSGPTGAAGVAATVIVGTVTTGAAGSSASVTNAGSTSAAVLNFTIPQGAAGSGGSGGGGGTCGIPFASVYHQQPSGSPGLTPEYYSVNNSTASVTESAAVLTWVPAGCTVTSLSVYSQLAAQTTLTLRSFATAYSTVNNSPTPTAVLTCTVAVGPSSTACTVPSGTQISAGSFIDYSMVDENGPTNPGVWTALACN